MFYIKSLLQIFHITKPHDKIIEQLALRKQVVENTQLIFDECALGSNPTKTYKKKMIDNY